MRLDRRRPGQARLPLRVPALAEPVGTVGGPILGETQNLGPGGMALRLKKALFAGAPVRVTLLLRPGLLFTMAGRAAWLRPHPYLPCWDLGIRFNEELPGQMVAGIASGADEPQAALADYWHLHT